MIDEFQLLSHNALLCHLASVTGHHVDRVVLVLCDPHAIKDQASHNQGQQHPQYGKRKQIYIHKSFSLIFHIRNLPANEIGECFPEIDDSSAWRGAISPIAMAPAWVISPHRLDRSSG